MLIMIIMIIIIMMMVTLMYQAGSYHYWLHA